MKKMYLEVDELINHFRYETRALKYAQALEHYAERHAVEAVAVGDSMDGYVIEVTENNGKPSARLQTWTKELKQKCLG